MPKKNKTPWDKWAFNAAWILAIVLAIFLSFGQAWAMNSTWSLILIILGLITGFTHSIKDVGPFILIAVALVIFSGSSLVIIPYGIGSFLVNSIAYFTAYLTPAALIVALRKVYTIFK